MPCETKCSWSEADFCLSATADVAEVAATVYDRVCRTDFEAPGFCLINLGKSISSQVLRRFMLALKDEVRNLHRARLGRHLIVVSAARFDQQVTTKPHRDGGPDECLLLLGYEPSRVRAELRMSDYARCAFDMALTPAEFLEKHNPMYAANARLLEDYTTRVTCFSSDCNQLLVINNSSAAYSKETPRWQGVLHTATILNPDASHRRVVNSMMVASAPTDDIPDPISAVEQDEFARTSLVRRAGYDKPELADDL
jgi:hypothetical protein